MITCSNAFKVQLKRKEKTERERKSKREEGVIGNGPFVLTMAAKPDSVTPRKA